MEKKSSLLFLLLFLAVTNVLAQESCLVTYDGGFFVKQGINWTEYRLEKVSGPWATYTQYLDEKNYFKIRNSNNELSIPKERHNKIYILKNGKWKVIYNTLQVYNYFNDKSRAIYTYEGGYFVRDGLNWREYRPADKEGIWASYTQYYNWAAHFYIKNNLIKIRIPITIKTFLSTIEFEKNGKWVACYKTSAIYDPFMWYEYVFNFDYYRVDVNGTFKDYYSPAKLCLSRNGQGLIAYGRETHTFNIKALSIYGKEQALAFIIYPKADSREEFIIVFDNGWCAINLPGICEYINFRDGKDNYNKTYNAVIKRLKAKNFFEN